MKNYLIYSVEDDSIYRRIIQKTILSNKKVELKLFENAKSLLNELINEPDIILVDYNLPDVSGMELILKLKEICPDSVLIVISAQDNIDVALDIIKNGVFEYIPKNSQTTERLLLAIQKAIGQVDMNQELYQLRKELKEKFNFSINLHGISYEMKEVFRLMEKTLTNSITVNVFGETGTGKELVAKAIHYNSDRRKKPFVAINLASFPSDLFESELFGQSIISNQGEEYTKIGKFEEANGGTLFLDEISELSIENQGKLLRVIQEMELCRVGSNEVVKLNFRLIIASNKDLENEVNEGRFREDLYYRLLGMKIVVPPLRKRGNDILVLANYFISKFSDNYNMEPKKLTEEANTFLLRYKFPGNVRELKTMIETAFLLSENNCIDVSDFSVNSKLFVEDLMKTKRTLSFYNSKIITHYLELNKGNVLKTADDLGVGKTTIYRMLKEGKVVNTFSN